MEKYNFSISSGQLGALVPSTTINAQDSSGIDFGTTFNLGISQRQKQDKEGVVLPHFVAQKEGQTEEGQIEYILDAEDDFDDEEDVDEDLLI